MSLFHSREPFQTEIERVQAYQSVFGSESGQRVLYDIACRTRLFEICSEIDPQLLAARQGERNVVIRIEKILEMSLERLKELMKEEINDGP